MTNALAWLFTLARARPVANLHKPCHPEAGVLCPPKDLCTLLAAPVVPAGCIGPFDFAQGRLFAAKCAAQDDNAWGGVHSCTTTTASEPPQPCHPEAGRPLPAEGPVHFAAALAVPAGCIGPSPQNARLRMTNSLRWLFTLAPRPLANLHNLVILRRASFARRRTCALCWRRWWCRQVA